jgi:hypothetical protein
LPACNPSRHTLAVGGCYHIIAARRAIGLSVEEKRRVINLTQLRKNSRKRPDKTSGRKRPRIADVDVVAVGDHDEQTLTEADDHHELSQPTVSAVSQPIDDSRCVECGLEEPPKVISASKKITWIQCDTCLFWYHKCCFHLHALHLTED